MAIVGAFARVEADGFDRTVTDLDALDRVSTFELDEPGKVGLLVETENIDEAHRIITKMIPKVEGVMGAWPVYANTEDETEND